MWKFKNIPKILNLYWGRNKPLSFLRYMTVSSFQHHNPDWSIQVFYPERPVKDETWKTDENKGLLDIKDYFPELKNLDNVEVVSTKELLKDIKISKEKAFKKLSEVHKSDLLRWLIMFLYGGVWSDFDILYLKPMNRIDPNNKLNKKATCIFPQFVNVRKKLITPVGFFLGASGNMVFEDIYNRGIQDIIIDQMGLEYQSIGRYLLEETLRQDSELVYDVMNGDVVYPYKGSQAPRLYFGEIERNDFNYHKKETIGLHWFAGWKGCKRIEKEITEDNLLYLISKMPLITEIVRSGSVKKAVVGSESFSTANADSFFSSTTMDKEME